MCSVSIEWFKISPMQRWLHVHWFSAPVCSWAQLVQNIQSPPPCSSRTTPLNTPSEQTQLFSFANNKPENITSNWLASPNSSHTFQNRKKVFSFLKLHFILYFKGLYQTEGFQKLFHCCIIKVPYGYVVSLLFSENEKSIFCCSWLHTAALRECRGKSSPKLKETRAQVSASNKQICPAAY